MNPRTLSSNELEPSTTPSLRRDDSVSGPSFPSSAIESYSINCPSLKLPLALGKQTGIIHRSILLPRVLVLKPRRILDDILNQLLKIFSIHDASIHNLNISL